MDSDTQIVTMTERAREAVLQARSGQDEASQLALWLEITGESGGEYTYDLYLMHIDEASPGDVVQRHGELSVVIPRESLDKVQGATIDLSSDPGFVAWLLMNPNRPEPQVRGPLIDPSNLMRRPDAGPPASPEIRGEAPDLSGDVAQRVSQVLHHQINPSIAAHGGRAELVAVEDQTAYLRLGGGCQGCAMASVTLTQGIKVAITDAIPEIDEVVDVTDHAQGDDPYFQSAKK
ncbi:MAG: NifU family protein [Actinomycetota bacterium]